MLDVNSGNEKLRCSSSTSRHLGGTMQIQEAVDKFQGALYRSTDLILVHRQLGTLRAAANANPTARGRRQEEVSINGAVVVLTVAAWQAIVQDLTTVCLDTAEPAPGGPISPATYRATTGVARQGIGSLNTPNAENTQKLMRSAGFDPRPHWTWTQSAGAGQPARTVNPQEAATNLNAWVKLRHLVAHGSEIEQLDILDAVKERKRALAAMNPPQQLPQGWVPTIRLTDADRVVAYFRRVARLTASGMAQHLGVNTPTW